MDRIFEALKSFLCSNVNSELEEMEGESLSIPAINAQFVKFGTVDVTKLKSRVIVSILPESQEEEEGDTADYRLSNRFLVTFISSGDEASRLLKRCCRYAEAFRLALLKSPDLDGKVEECGIGKRTFYPDAGTTEGQLSAVEIELTVFTEAEPDF